jgi:hypothetical protein
MSKRIVVFLLLASLFLSAFLQVPSRDLKISYMEVDIWPEYDQPSVLVIFRISFSSITNFPARVSLRIPASAGDPYSVAMKDLDGMLYDLEYSVVPDGVWNKIEFVTSSQDMQIEFYEPYYQASDITRAYNFSWISDYPIDDLVVIVQKPKFATIMSTLPDAGKGVLNADDGLTYFSMDFNSIEMGATVDVDISYIKTNDGLSASTTPVKPVTPLPGSKTIWQTLISIFPSLWQNKSIIVSGLLLLAALMVFNTLVVVVRGVRASREETGKKNPAKSRDLASARDAREVYCYHCGKRARAGDVFCRTCGSRLTE